MQIAYRGTTKIAAITQNEKLSRDPVEINSKLGRLARVLKLDTCKGEFCLSFVRGEYRRGMKPLNKLIAKNSVKPIHVAVN